MEGHLNHNLSLAYGDMTRVTYANHVIISLLTTHDCSIGSLEGNKDNCNPHEAI